MTGETKQQVPHALEAEQALLGAILHSNGAIDRAREYVKAEDFYEEVHRHLFEVMCQRRDAGEAIDLGLMKAILGNADLGGITVGSYVGRLVTGATTISGAPDYARLIAQSAQMRLVLATAEAAVAAMSVDSVMSPAAYAAQMIEVLDEVASAGLSQSVKRTTLGTSVERVMARVRHLRTTNEDHGVTFGIPSLDRATLGMGESQFIVLAGRPAMGKTAAALHFAIAAARRAGPVGFMSLEMNDVELGQRVLSAVAYDPREYDQISYRSIAQARDLTDDALRRLYFAEREAARIPIWIEPQPGVTLSQIAARSRQMALRAERQGKRLAAIIVDHMGLVRPSGRYAGNRVQEMTEISGGLKGLAKELAIPVVGLCQLSRAVETREDKRPILSDLRDSGSIEQDADVVLGLFREAYYLERKPDLKDDEADRLARRRNVLEIEILKQRSGPTIRIDCFCDVACNVLAEMAT
ncbi:AAA family ATPase [Methylobacterium sp. BTF04]|uniref:replicative DNA helicase n=1 Tax=Methylobacterium sp. BTF04 TaxID=2708300 RepID=UPI0013D48C66|nr:DnaB-like helicase C-terminal domain-containing protein [Methylobacterium sp. BTF04]NEU13568.1 AAA family ATPase [Methylobacterium sp. BTF04]